MTRATDAEARRDASGARTKAALLPKRCPKCRVKRLWEAPILGGRGLIRCLECGAQYRKKTKC